jgi:hypothetical protein
MDAQLFLEYLPWLKKPSYFYTSKLGTSEWKESDVQDAIARGKRDFTLHEKVIQADLRSAPESLQTLYAQYDLKNLHMLWTSFWSEPKQLEQGWGFADMSEVNLVVAPSGQIEAYAAHPIRGMPRATDRLGILAKDLESYLEAMLYGQFNATHFISGFPDENPILFEKTVLVAKHCALIAGGYEYYDFWAGLLGLPPPEAVPE